MDTKRIHENYHSRITLQKRIIDDKNFTYRNILSFIDGVLANRKLRILDIGSGVGTLDFYLSKKGHVVTGIDISKKAVTMAKKNATVFSLKNIKFYVGNVNRFMFTKKFDLIMCSEIIEHVEDDRGLLKTLNLHLKKNGVIILTTPLISAPLCKIGLTKNFDKRVGHLRRYDLHKLKDLVGSSNLKIIDVKYHEGVFRNLFFVFDFFNPVVRLANRFFLISDVFTFLDNLSQKLVGPSNIYVIVKKK